VPVGDLGAHPGSAPSHAESRPHPAPRDAERERYPTLPEMGSLPDVDSLGVLASSARTV